MKNLIQALLCLFLAVPAFAQSSLIGVTGSLLGDSRGTSGGLLNNATITFTPVLNDGTPTSYRRGTSGGQSILSPISTNVSNGTFSLVVADTAFTSPANVCYSVTVTDNITGNNLLGSGYSCVQPTSTDTSWCSLSGSVYSCNFDNYTPNLSPLLAVQSGPPGPPLTFNGTWSNVITYTPGSAVSYLGNVYAALIRNTNNVPSSSPVDWAPVLSPASLLSVPGGTQTVSQPNGTTFQSTSINGELNASLFPGSDIGAKINAAVAALPSGCGMILLPPAPSGGYSLTTTIHLHRCTKLIGSSGLGTLLNWQSTTGTAVIVSDNDGGGNYPEGYIADIALVGLSNSTGSAIGLYLGGNPGCTGGCTDNPDSWFGDNFAVYNSKISFFKTGVSWGNHAFLEDFYSTMISNNGEGIRFDTGLSDSGEAISFFGSKIVNSETYGIDIIGYSDFYFYGVGCDYNVVGCASVTGASQTHFIGDHIEQGGGVLITIGSSADTRLVVDVSGSTLIGSVSGITATASVGATFTGSGSGTSLTVTAVTGFISVGDSVSGTGIPTGTVISSQASGTPNGAGAYITNNSTTASGTVTSFGGVVDVTAVSGGTLAIGNGLAGGLIASQVSGPTGGAGIYTISVRAGAYLASSALIVATDPAMITVADPSTVTLNVNHSLILASHGYHNFLKWDPATFQPLITSSVDLTGNTGLYADPNIANVMSTPCVTGTSFFQTCITRSAAFSHLGSLTAVAANTCSFQDINFPGYRVGDVVVGFNKATPQLGLLVQAAPPGAGDHLPAMLCNLTASPITPTVNDLYTLVIQR
jgi:hypothetical protein